jgi:4-amino-4-deoxy-L-arabinose transferase-like glycosyltransferase
VTDASTGASTTAAAQQGGRIGGPLGWVRAHPDLAAVLLIVLVAAGIRLAFAFRVPAFVTKDSIEYVQPALALVEGGPFVLAQRRTPVYPLFMAGSIALFGRDLLAITFAQHLLGIGTAVLTFGIGRLTFGRWVGLAGGLLAALSSPLLIYEHYLITESTFTFFLILAIFLFVAGLRTRLLRYFALGGLALGLAALTRPVGQAILFVLPLAFLPVLGWRPTLKALALTVACFALLIVPWTVRNKLVFGEAQPASMGRFLISRSVKHERNFKFYDEAVGAYPGEAPERTRARKIAQEVTDKRPEPGQIFQRIRDNLGLTEAQTDAMLRDIALEAIARDPMLWVNGTVGMFFELVEGAPKEESVTWHLGGHNQPRVANQWGGLRYLLQDDMTLAQARQIEESEWLGRVFRPTQFAWWIAGLAVLGGAVAASRARLRPALLPALVTWALIAASVALVGEVPRYRYPVDPLMYVLAAGGLASAVGLVLAGARRLRGKPARIGGAASTSAAERPVAPRPA